MDTIKLREAWLTKLAAAMLPEIKRLAGADLDFGKYRVSCGFPSRGGEMGRKGTVVTGQCWSSEASADRHSEIFISPILADLEAVVPTLAHELLHAAMPKSGHGRQFQIAAAKLGMVKPFTQSIASDEFWAWARPLLKKLGGYPHAPLTAMAPVAKKAKKGTYLLKAECGVEGCGYTVRVTKKWIVDAGAPICPRKGHGAMICEVPDDDDFDGEED